MKNLPSRLESVYFLGIGGIGMSALARYFRLKGCRVSGYDRTPSELTRKLEGEGMDIHYQDDPALLPSSVDLVVYTPAIPDSHAEWQYLRAHHYVCMKRAEVLGAISRDLYTVAFAGTHGKTSMTSLASLLFQGQEPIISFIGGIAVNFQSNFFYEKEAKTMVVEADEFDRSFLQLEPNIAVVSSMDADHLDIYGTVDHLREAFDQFSKQIRPGGCLITKPELRPYFHTSSRVYTYSLHDTQADFHLSDLCIEDGTTRFDIHTPSGCWHRMMLPTAGLYNVENALAAVAAAYCKGAGEAGIRSRLALYKGVKRRFEYIIRRPDLVFVDDYAHHPNELKACIESAREWYPGKKICGVFQPHLYTRTRDFADEFAAQLSTLDKVVLLDIYPAREEPIEGVDSRMLLDKITQKDKILCTKEELIPYLKSVRPEVLLTMGAGDIDRLVVSIKKALEV